MRHMERSQGQIEMEMMIARAIIAMTIDIRSGVLQEIFARINKTFKGNRKKSYL